ncbi:DNA-binding transcriptional regulator, GntR family [Nitratireductor aquibiodomus]|uniref:DNA-binding transcriptional regulator, GntR family n=1 Tax=Nitratireductor aquibiodomus TaxID=204799 RepID=A0A1H4KFX0_9HYPH|nr:GntR family transcriptional regulator [Nitratireductor aquibiodomus]SEB57156.1 DNA-binding transcriptional regulator, GntR family [Nitratireductor aquibiodomus]
MDNPADSTNHEVGPRIAGLRPISGEAVSLHEEILASVRNYLLEGSLPDGARIPERLLCEQMGVSRTPLREALKVLAAEGLVDLLPNRGARVRSYDDSDIKELFQVMGGLEALAGRLACEEITEDEVKEIERLHYKMYSCYMRRDLPAYFDLNQKIHNAIVAAARNALLTATHANFASRIQRIRYSANRESRRERWGEAMREHERMLDALQRRAGSELAGIMFEHLQNKRAAAISFREESGES